MSRPRKYQLTGQKFNRLTILEWSRNPNQKARSKWLWRCRCDCGQIKYSTSVSLLTGHDKSCGCAQREWYGSEDLKNLCRTANIGRTMDEETKQKISESNKKVIHTAEWNVNVGKARKGKANNPASIEKMRQTKLSGIGVAKGEDHWAWKGGVSKITHLIRNCSHYKQWVRTVFTRDNYTCQKCFKRCQKGQYVYLHAHHIKFFKDIMEEYDITSVPEARDCQELWEVSNGITFCQPCHYQHHKELNREDM